VGTIKCGDGQKTIVVWSGASTSKTKVGEATCGDAVTIKGAPTGGYVSVRLADGKSGFVRSNAVVAKQKPGDQKADKDTVFGQDKPFDAESYTGGMNFISTAGDEAASIALYVKDGTGYKAYGSLEIKGRILLGGEGVLAYTDTFRRIKLTGSDNDWKDIGRKAIRNGRLFIETKGDLATFTIYGFNAAQYTAVIEPGIHPKP
jgi:hypothetical protein